MAAMPPVPFKVKALAAYTPTDSSQLELVVGQIYEVTNTDGKGIWVQSQVNGVFGWFPFSYTQVIPSTPSGPPPNSLPNKPSGAIPSTASATSTTASASPPTKTASSGVKKSSKSKSKKDKPTHPGPPLKLHVEKNKKNSPITCLVQIVRAKLPVPDNEVGKLEPTAFIFTRDLLGDEEGKKFEGTQTMKKTSEPHWNEGFKMVITDAESQTLVIRVCNGKEYNKKKNLGEFQILLRGSHRGDFEGQGQYKWHYLTKDAVKDGPPKKETAVGKILLYIHYVDTRETGKPTNFQRLGHIGWSAETGFDMSNIPPEWKAKFREMGITKAALQSDQNLAQEVFHIMEKADADAAAGHAPVDYTPAFDSGAPAPPPPPPMNTGGGAPPPPPAPIPRTSVPATPAYQQQEQSYEEEAQEEQPEENSLLASIRRGASLKPVDAPAEKPLVAEEAPEENSLSGLLKKAMAGRLQIANGEDDWSEDEPEDDDWD